MRHANPARLHQQVAFLRCPFAQDGDLPFSDVLSEELVTHALTKGSVTWIDRIYSPLVTLWVFPQPGPQRRPLLPGSRRPPDRPPRGAGAKALLRRGVTGAAVWRQAARSAPS